VFLYLYSVLLLSVDGHCQCILCLVRHVLLPIYVDYLVYFFSERNKREREREGHHFFMN